MSTMMHPVGPQPPSVYWVRRVLAILVVVALLLGVRWLLGGRGDATPAASPSGSPSSSGSSPSSTPSATTTPSSSTTASATATATSTASPTGSATAGAACPDSAITVTASTDAASYPVGSTPRLRMKIQNSSTVACKRNVGADVNELVISSGSARVWSSDDCSPGGPGNVATLAPGQSYSVSVTWLGRVSKKGCPANQPLAAKGTYKLVGRNGTISSAPASFTLT